MSETVEKQNLIVSEQKEIEKNIGKDIQSIPSIGKKKLNIQSDVGTVKKKFYFKNLSRQEMVNILNIEYPVRLRYNYDLVKRVHARYPMATEYEVGSVIRSVFQSFRDLLILGKEINIYNLLLGFRLKMFVVRRNEKDYPGIMPVIKAAPCIKKFNCIEKDEE